MTYLLFYTRVSYIHVYEKIMETKKRPGPKMLKVPKQKQPKYKNYFKGI